MCGSQVIVDCFGGFLSKTRELDPYRWVERLLVARQKLVTDYSLACPGFLKGVSQGGIHILSSASLIILPSAHSLTVLLCVIFLPILLPSVLFSISHRKQTAHLLLLWVPSITSFLPITASLRQMRILCPLLGHPSGPVPTSYHHSVTCDSFIQYLLSHACAKRWKIKVIIASLTHRLQWALHPRFNVTAL